MNITKSKIPAQARSKYWNNSAGATGRASTGAAIDISGKLDKSIWDENINATETLIELLKATRIKGDGEVTGNLLVRGEAATFSLDGVEVFGASGSQYLNDLLDVTVTNPLKDQYLKYNGVDWVNSTISYSELTGVPTTFTPSAHTHLISDITNLQTTLNSKVDIVDGKGLSTNDYTTEEKTKLSGIETGAQVNKVTSVAGKTGIVTLVKADVGLANVDNTSDLNKPISTATQTALDGKLGINETAADSHKLGGRLAADFWHIENSNLPSVDWDAKDLNAAGNSTICGNLLVKGEATTYTLDGVETKVAPTVGAAYLWELIDVDDALKDAPDGSILIKTNGIWKAVEAISLDAGDYKII